MKKNLILILLINIFITTFLHAKSSDKPNWFFGVGATMMATSSALVPTSAGATTYTETEYESDIGDGLDQFSLHIGYIWDMYDGIEVSYSQMAFNNNAGTKEGTLTLTEIDRIISFQDWNIGFTNQKIDILVPFMKIGIGMASWSDDIATTTEDISGTVGKVSLGFLLHFGPGLWADVSYSVRSIGFLGTSAAEQAPLQTANLALKVLF